MALRDKAQNDPGPGRQAGRLRVRPDTRPAAIPKHSVCSEACGDQPHLQVTGPEHDRAAAANVFSLCFPLFLVDAVRRVHPVALQRFHLLPRGRRGPGAGPAGGRSLRDHRQRLDRPDRRSDGARLPPTQGRHFDLTLIDTAGEPFASLGSRTGDDGGVDVAVEPPLSGDIPRGPSDAPVARATPAGRSAASTPIRRPTVPTPRPSPGSSASARRGGDPTARPIASPAWSRPRRRACARSPNWGRRCSSIAWTRCWTARRPASSGRCGRCSTSSAATWAARRRPPAGRRIGPRRWTLGSPTAWRRSGRPPPRSRKPGGGLARGARAEARRAGASSAQAGRAYCSLGAPAREELLTLICEHDSRGRPLRGDQARVCASRPTPCRRRAGFGVSTPGRRLRATSGADRQPRRPWPSPATGL